MKAKKFFLIAIASLIGHYAIGQSFEIPIYFEDTAGYRDTIILGYDPAASYDLDTSFGEINIIDSSYNDDFEVRAAIYDYGFEYGVLPRIIESEKMIIGNICFDPMYFDEANSIMVVIKSQNWPVSLSWDNNLFQEGCNFIDIIDCTPGGWFDVCGGGHPYSLLQMRLTDTATYYSTEFMIELEEDTLNALFFRFYNDFGSGVEDESEKTIVFYPNPTEGSIYLDYPLSAADKIIVTDIMGRPVSFTYSDQHVGISGSPDGIYLLKAQLRNGDIFALKIIKTSR